MKHSKFVPSAADLKFLCLKIEIIALGLNLVPEVIYGPSGTNENIRIPPAKDIAETKKSTCSHGNEPPILLIKWGKAVPNTKAPTSSPIALPNPFLYQPAAIFIPIG